MSLKSADTKLQIKLPVNYDNYYNDENNDEYNDDNHHDHNNNIEFDRFAMLILLYRLVVSL